METDGLYACHKGRVVVRGVRTPRAYIEKVELRCGSESVVRTQGIVTHKAQDAETQGEVEEVLRWTRRGGRRVGRERTTSWRGRGAMERRRVGGRVSHGLGVRLHGH